MAASDEARGTGPGTDLSPPRATFVSQLLSRCRRLPHTHLASPWGYSLSSISPSSPPAGFLVCQARELHGEEWWHLGHGRWALQTCRLDSGLGPCLF